MYKIKLKANDEKECREIIELYTDEHWRLVDILYKKKVYHITLFTTCLDEYFEEVEVI